MVNKGVKHARNHALKRCLYLMQRGEGDFGELSVELGVHPKTIRRDCVALRDAGFDVEIIEGKQLPRGIGRHFASFRITKEPDWFSALIAFFATLFAKRNQRDSA